MKKISSKDAASLLKQAGAAIRALQVERTTLATKVAQFEKRDRVEKIARDMEEKGLSSDLNFQQKVAAISRATNLDVTEEAVKLAAPQGNVLGDLGDIPAPGGSLSAFEHFVMTGEDVTE
jgi:hypothetical protein